MNIKKRMWKTGLWTVCELLGQLYLFIEQVMAQYIYLLLSFAQTCLLHNYGPCRIIETVRLSKLSGNES